MTPPASPDPIPAELLAAYADGELDPETRAAVERWLHEHPGAIEELRAQRELSPLNAALWDRAGPVEPSEEVWAAVGQGIADALHPPTDVKQPRGRGWRVAAWLLGGLTAAGAAAAVGWLAFGLLAPRQPSDEPKPPESVKHTPAVAPAPRAVAAAPRRADPLADYPVLAMATDDDVILERVPEFPAGWLPVGRHPLQGVLVLASEEEVLLGDVDPSPAWPTGGPRITTAPGDAPVIYAAKPR
jgi:hypothetical protein